MRRLKVVDSLGDRVDVGKVFDNEGVARSGREAVAVWREHFEEVLNEGDSGWEGEVHW